MEVAQILAHCSKVLEAATGQKNLPRNFEAEKQKIKDFIQKIQTGGENKCTTHPHPFFGKLTPTPWSIGMHKHLDHHLRQFGA